MRLNELLGLPPSDDEALRVLLQALQRYGLSIDGVKDPNVRRRLRELEKEQGSPS